MNANTIKEVVVKLVGPVYPIGETNTDDKRFDNLVVLCDLTNELITLIDGVAWENRDCVEYSRKRAGDFARKVLIERFGITE
jgi:hypothetical protein